jgi:hypothetical protein
MAIDIVFVPHVSDLVLLVLTALAVAVVGAGALLGAPGILWRAVATAGALLVLANPSIIEEERKGLPDVAVIVADQSQSQSIGDRSGSVTRTVAALRARLSEVKDLEVRVVTVTGNQVKASDGGTRLIEPMREALADVPPDRIAGAILVTDGQVHDVPQASSASLGYPVHTLLTGTPGERDRKLTIIKAPRFGIVNEPIRFTLRVDDFGNEAAPPANVEIRIDGKIVETLEAQSGKEATVDLRLPHGGENVIEFAADKGPDELTLLNNRAAIVATGIRDQLKVLLVSGEPHAGQRTLRNLLKADPSVSLVHFTILRPLEKQDGTPNNELSLIAFPTAELFDRKLGEFNLIIFDRYQRRGILPLVYYDNIARYVRNGGALLVTSGPEYASPYSLFRSPVASVLPAEPLDAVIEQGFRPRLTTEGLKHPVTTGLPGANTAGNAPTWGRWFRLVQSSVIRGQTLMNGASDKPLLVLNRIEKGRVALLLSDHAWLWTRNFEGGGPQAELLRRLAHWLMQEPDLEEERLHGSITGNRLTITRRTMSERASSVEVTFPSGRKETVTLGVSDNGTFSGTLKAEELGLYRLKDANLSAVAAAGPLNPKELSDVRATQSLLAPLVTANQGAMRWITRDGIPEIRRVRPGRNAAGSTWIGMQANEAYAISATRQTPLLHPALALIVVVGALLAGWRREGR